MKNFYIKDIHLNYFQKYVLKKEHERKNLLQRYVKKSNSMNFSNKNHSFQAKKTNQDFSENIAEEKTELEHPLKNSMITRQILTPIQKIKHRLIEPKKKNESEKENDFLTPIKNKFKLNNLVNSFLYKMYLDNSYKKLLFHRLEPYMNKKEKKVNIQIDLRNTRKGIFYIPIKNDNSRGKKNKKEIGIQNSLSSQNYFENDVNISNISENKNHEESKNFEIVKILNKKKIYSKINYNKANKINNNKNRINVIRQYSSKKMEKPPKINNFKLSFNKYELINKKLAKNFLEYSKNNKNKRYSKIKRVISTEREKMGKILDKLRYDQNNDGDKLKLDLVKLGGYITRKNKKLNNNSYNLFL